MSLEPCRKLGAYEVVALIAQGGMGEVYQARDTKLDRDVALKVLPEAFTSDPDRLARFEREAKVIASLNHPNILDRYALERPPKVTGDRRSETGEAAGLTVFFSNVVATAREQACCLTPALSNGERGIRSALCNDLRG